MSITTRVFSAIALVLLLSSQGHCQSHLTDTLSTQTKVKIDRIFADWNREDGPGGSVGIIENGKLIYAKGFGLANLEHNISNSSSTVFRIASTSKQFTAMCVLILAEDGEIQLKDPIGKFFPAMKPKLAACTIWQLLHHTSGIPDYLALHQLTDESAAESYTPEDSIGIIVRQSTLMFEPASDFSYSNSNYLLLGEIVARVKNSSLREFAEERVFAPLGMKHTHFHDDNTEVVKNRADGYEKEDSRWWISNTQLNHVGDGGVFTTVSDLLKWDQIFYSCPLPGGNKLIQKMLTTVPTSGSYGCGIDVSEYRGLKTHAHGGAFAGYRAQMLRFPDQKVSIICLANHARATPSVLAMEVADVLLGNKLSPRRESARRPKKKRNHKTKAPTTKELKSFVGVFSNDELPAIYTITLKKKGIYIDYGGEDLLLTAIAKDTFRIRGWRIHFVRGKNGQVTALEFRLSRTGTIAFKKTSDNH